MERERGHIRKGSTGNDLFICLSSSSSMKLSKSILSPAHRLRPNKASPFFPKKRLDNPEPSSPKVTCIGQVRVKTKKKKKKKNNRRSLSTRRADVSFRKIEPPQRTQGWVHLPVSICEALRTCFSVDGGKRREIELVVGAGDEYEESRVSTRRRHVFDDIEVEEEAARVSICIPPKNALLLMRCRSDPMKMAALTNRFQIEQCVEEIKEEELEISEEMVEDKVEMVVVQEEEEEEEESNMSSFEALLDQENTEQFVDCCPIQEEEQVESNPVCHLAPSIESDEAPPLLPQEPAAVMEEEAEQEESSESILLNNEVEGEGEGEGKEEDEPNGILNESILLNNEDEKDGDEESSIILNESILVNNEDEEKDQESRITLKESILLSKEDEEDEEPRNVVLVISEKEKRLLLKDEDEDQESISLNNEEEDKVDEQELVISEDKEKEKPLLSKDGEEEEEEDKESSIAIILKESMLLTNEGEEQQNEELVTSEKEKPLLPECLLLMMREPKLSMEVSRETWVCSTDFTRWRPRRDQRRVSVDSKAKRIQPPRSSCSLASMIEQKLANAAAHEPLVLTRCKSEPMRSAAAKLAPEWKARRAAGVGV
ncbi:glutamic acid-rich protein-like [Salvia divinorum]|uniref:Glutamic acid-rich protein-like n=1 Tax=Salvia divinorum TaxID=28513 RepID=A0ABD1G2F6_SALDI